jgi:hypothetical protein
VEPYTIQKPRIKSGSKYLFVTDFGIEYEVVFVRQRANVFHYTVAFGVLNDEFNGDEYLITNKGDVFKVITTIVEVLRLFLAEHPNITDFDFTGIDELSSSPFIMARRTKIYIGYLRLVFPAEKWDYKVELNTVKIKRK